MVGSCLVIDWIFSLGVDDPIECESNPQQSLEHNQQQGKQFDHTLISPITLKFNISFTLYVCIAYFVVKLLVNP